MTNPLPKAFVLLIVLLPAIGILGRSIADLTGCDRKTRAVLTPALALAPWLLTIHIIGRITHSFPTALVAGTSIVALAGALLFVRQRKTKNEGAKGEPPSRWMWIGAAVSAAILAPAAFGWALHDELKQTGHMSLAAQMVNGVYPPRHMTFPLGELHYHYGFDLLVAITTALTRLRTDHAIDVLVVLSWAWSFCLAWVIGERATSSRGWIVATTLLFGGGIPILCAEGRPTTLADTIGSCKIDGLWPNPPLTSYIFQHPWTLGLPIALATLLLANERALRPIPRLLALGTLLVMLSLSQFTLFVTLTPSLLAQEFFSAEEPPKRALERLLGAKFSPRHGLLLLATALAAVLVASRLGGFFSHEAGGGGPSIIRHNGVTESFAGTMRWLAASFGLLLPLGIAGLVFAPRIRMVGLCLMGGSLLVINTLRVQQTWDIVKFATVGAIAFSMLAGVTIDRLVSFDKSKIGRPLAAIVFAGATAAGLVYPLLFGFLPQSIPALFDRNAVPLTGADAEAVDFVRRHIAPGEIVYRAKAMSMQYAIWGGLPVVWPDRHTVSFGFGRDRIDRREKLVRDLPKQPEPYLEENVRWFVLDEAQDRTLSQNADAWIASGRAKEWMKSGRLRVIELSR